MDDEKDPTLVKFGAWKSESEQNRSQYQSKWVRNMKLVDGIFSEDEGSLKSKVRNRQKIFYRKIWAMVWRMIADFYTAFLRDQDTFKIAGRGYNDLGQPDEDALRARILHFMTEYRRDVMMHRDSLFKKFIWAFQDIAHLGWAVGKMYWSNKRNEDMPRFILYPPEQAYPDWRALEAGNPQDMRFFIFQNFLTRDQMEAEGYDNIDKAEASSIPSNIVRQTRFMGEHDPLQNPGQNEYPSPGRYIDDRKDSIGEKLYEVWETFYWEDDEIKFAVSNRGEVWLKKPETSPFGNIFPIVMGECLLKAHKPIGEGFPEPLAGPQESLNYILNQRKDNLALLLNRHTLVSRWGGVDLHSLTSARPGGVTLMDDVNAVKEREMQDVTQSAYIEAASDDMMMQEMGGITAGKQGMEKSDKATVAQINYAEANMKSDLHTAIVAETFVKNFFYLLAFMIQRFETNETVYRVANQSLTKELKTPIGFQIYDIEELDFDCVVNVGAGSVGRDIEIRNTMLAMDRAVMANQSLIQLLGTGAVPPTGIRIFDTTRFMEDLLPKIGKKNVQEYFFKVMAPMGQPGQPPALAGAMQPQIGNTGFPVPQNDLQRGSFGGI